MRVITVHQPWATMIADGEKTIETRTHYNFKCLVGERIAIHASKNRNRQRFCTAIEEINTMKDGNRFNCKREYENIEKYPSGMIICSAYVTGFRELEIEDCGKALCKTVGLNGLILIGSWRLVTPIPARGRQGIWKFDM